MKHANRKPAAVRISRKAPEAMISPMSSEQNALAQRSKEARNRAYTRRNSAKVEQYLIEVEKVHGFAESWALRERFERGQVSLDELTRR